MLKPLLFFFLSILSYTAFSQGITIKGSLQDTASGTDMKNTVITMLHAKDSTLASFSRAASGGSFEVKNLPAGEYIMLVSHPQFADYVELMTLRSDTTIETIDMLSKAVMLEDVIVRGSPIRMKGDTLAYMADSFKVKDGATVEDLLKQLPGIQVNSKGEITAQGERVQKVLVDGDEFFGDDPTLATQNMISKAVKEVQVFDKKSEQADFTGVDDGQKTKTINLKLKDEYKKGYFGKVDLAGGLPDRWENSAMVNFFKDKRKLSVYGKMANTGATGLGWTEETNYGGNMGMETQVTDDGGIMINMNSDEFGSLDRYNGEGLPKSWMAGGSYANKWNENKNSLVGAYRYQRLSTIANTTTNTQYILPDTQYFNNQSSMEQASRWRNKANLKADIAIDSMQSLSITANGSYGESTMYNQFTSESLTGSKVPVNRNNRTVSAAGTNGTFNTNLLYKKKFKKPKRTLSVNVSEKYSMNTSDGFLRSNLDLFSEGAYIGTDTIDQKKNNENNSLTIDGRAAYTEPVGKNGIVEVAYGFGYSNSEQKRLSYDANNGKYEELNDLYSNDYRFVTTTHKVSAGYRYSYKKLTYGFGTDVAHANWKQTNLFTDTVRTYNFNNFFPRANLNYKLGQYSSLRFNYSGRTRAPRIDQLQPVLNNEDPLNVAVGNPNLKQSFSNNFNIGYNFYQVLSKRGLWANVYFNPTSNDFSTLDRVDTLGRRIYQTVNVDGNYNFGGYMGYNFNWKKPDLNFYLSFNPSIYRNNNFINGEANTNKNSSYNVDFSINKYKADKYQFNISLDAGYNYATSSIRPDVVTKYWTSRPSASGGITILKNMEINTDFQYNWRQQTAVFANNNNTFIWNANINKRIMKKQDLRVGVVVRDILNQNIGFNRNANSNYVTERTYNVIRRYWMATLTWKFNKGPNKEQEW